MHLENHFCLLREDMVGEIREEVQIALGNKTEKYSGFVIEGLALKDLYCKRSDDDTNVRYGGGRNRFGENRIREKDYLWVPWPLTLEHKGDSFWFKKCKNAKAREAYFKDNPRFLRHQSLACLIADGEVVAFPSIVRDEKLLANNRPIIVLQFDNGKQGNALMRLPKAKHVQLIHIDTAVFSYEPILTALQMKRTLPLEEKILFFRRVWHSILPPTNQRL